jgi:formate-dependent nitrite reductase membrane component NrfD
MTAGTMFSASPHWSWLISLYFFVGGIAGGALFLSAMMRLLGGAEHRQLVRLGHFIALAGAGVSGALLTVDLDKPLRFWHMLIDANTGGAMFKPWSPMSVGAWGLLLFAAVALLATLGSLSEMGRLRWRATRALTHGAAGIVLSVAGAVLGLFFAGYTGVLLAVTNRPLWADSSWLGVLFLCSGVSTAAASLMLLSRRGAAPGPYDWLRQFDRRVMLLELAALIAFVVSLGPVARLLAGWWGLALLIGVAGVGIVVPVLLDRAHDATGPGDGGTALATRFASPWVRAMVASACVLFGGLVLRVVVVMSSEQASIAAVTVVK